MAAALDGVNGTVCNALQYQRFLSSQDPPIACLSRGQTIGMTVSNLALSMLFFKLIPRTVDSRSSVPESRFCDLRLYLDWRKPISPSLVCPGR
jgi:hypothetical protein